MTTKAINVNNLLRTRESITRLATAVAYTAGDAISNGSGNTHYTFKGPGVDSKYGGTIIGATFHSTIVTTTNRDYSLLLYRKDFTVVVDNAAFELTDAESLEYIGKIDVVVADWQIAAANKMAQVTPNLNFQTLKQASGVGAIYGQLVAATGHTPTASDVITVELLIRQD